MSLNTNKDTSRLMLYTFVIVLTLIGSIILLSVMDKPIPSYFEVFLASALSFMLALPITPPTNDKG